MIFFFSKYKNWKFVFLFFFNKDEKVYIKFIIITVHNLIQSVGSCVVDRQGSSELI